MSRELPASRLGNMRCEAIDRLFGVEAALRELFRDVVRDELRYLREEIAGWLEVQGRPAPCTESEADELLTIAQVASAEAAVRLLENSLLIGKAYPQAPAPEVRSARMVNYHPNGASASRPAYPVRRVLPKGPRIGLRALAPRSRDAPLQRSTP